MTETDIPHRTAHQLLLQHHPAHNDRHGPQSHHADASAVSFPPYPLPPSSYKSKSDSPPFLPNRYTKDEMQRELLENMYRANELDDLLKESDYTIRRRKECIQMVESLSKASEIVSQVQ